MPPFLRGSVEFSSGQYYSTFQDFSKVSFCDSIYIVYTKDSDTYVEEIKIRYVIHTNFEKVHQSVVHILWEEEKRNIF